MWDVSISCLMFIWTICLKMIFYIFFCWIIRHADDDDVIPDTKSIISPIELLIYEFIGFYIQQISYWLYGTFSDSMHEFLSKLGQLHLYPIYIYTHHISYYTIYWSLFSPVSLTKIFPMAWFHHFSPQTPNITLQDHSRFDPPQN